MQKEEQGLSIEELAERVNVPVRTVRFYIAEGLLAGPGARGKAAFYGEEHLLRLELIRRLVSQHVPLKEIKERLSRLSVNEIRALLTEEVQREAALRQAELSPKAYLSTLLQLAQARETIAPRPTPMPKPPMSDTRWLRARLRSMEEAFELREEVAPRTEGEVWHRWELAPGVELHVRSDVEGRNRSLIERLFQVVREITGRGIK